VRNKKEIKIYDVAKKANVSITVVSQVLNNTPNARISSDTRKKVLKIAKQLNYVPNVFARSLVTKKSNLVGLIVPDLVHSFIPEIIQGIENIAIKFNYGIIMYTTNSKREREINAINNLVRKRADGIIYITSHPTDDVVKSLEKFRNTISVGFYRNSILNYVYADNFDGAYKATEYLIKLGRKYIVHISENKSDAGIDRKKGYLKALSDYNVHYKKIYSSQFSFEGGYNTALKIISEKIKVNAIFANSDITAIGVIKALNENKIKIPDDVAIIGFDDLAISKLLNLTTVAQPKLKMGEKAMELLLKKINGDEIDNIVLPVKLVIRGTA